MQDFEVVGVGFRHLLVPVHGIQLES
jgi:hypothetical protein